MSKYYKKPLQIEIYGHFTNNHEYELVSSLNGFVTNAEFDTYDCLSERLGPLLKSVNRTVEEAKMGEFAWEPKQGDAELFASFLIQRTFSGSIPRIVPSRRVSLKNLSQGTHLVKVFVHDEPGRIETDIKMKHYEMSENKLELVDEIKFFWEEVETVDSTKCQIDSISTDIPF